MHFPATSQSSDPYLLIDAFPGAQFDKPVAVASVPGETNRVFVAERLGRIMVINDLSNPVPEVFLDIRSRVVAGEWNLDIESRRTEGLTSLAFHPNFKENGRFFVTYCTITTTSQGDGHHNRLSEFRANGATADSSSEIPYITQFDEGHGHNINDVHFGPDGYLYVAIGDEGDGGDGDDYNNAQRIDKDFFSAILRFDVDKKEGNLRPNPHSAADIEKYAIPADNPFIGATSFNGKPVDPAKVRTEFFAVGFRNAWRMSFDPLTGDIYEGDVGQHDREEVNKVVKGGNYGWAFWEGTYPGPKGAPPAGVQLIEPLVQYIPGYGSDQGYSVTGGVVSRNHRIPNLYGYYLFGDFESGNVWAMNVDQQPVGAPIRLLAEKGIASFGYDPRDGDVLMVNHNRGKLQRLTIPTNTAEYPAKLSETGIFRDLASLQPHDGIYPYELNLPFWSDGAVKSRWFSLPDPAMKFGFRAEENWVHPAGAVWIKHFDLELSPGDPASRKRIETRVLVRTPDRGYGLTYKWNDEGTDAELVNALGENKTFTITENGKAREQVWSYPGRQQCLSCHSEAGGFALGFNTAQLNRDAKVGGKTMNQISALADAGFLSSPPAGVHGLRKLAALDDESVSRTYRVKSYLAANCSFCHQPGGTAQLNANWDGRITTPTSQAGLLWGALFNSTDPEEKVVVPGRPERSALIHRMEALGKEKMPPVGRNVVDQHALELLTRWVAEETSSFEGFNQWAARTMPDVAEANRSATADADGDGVNNYSEYLIGSNPLDPASKLGVNAMARDGQMSFSFTQPRNRGVIVETAPGPEGPWTIFQSPGNEMQFPAQPLMRDLLDSVHNSKQMYRLRVIEP